MKFLAGDEGFDGVARSARKLAPSRWAVGVLYTVLAGMTLGVMTAVIWGAAFVVAETLNWLATSAYRPGGTPTQRSRLGYLGAVLAVNAVWLGLAFAYWFSSSPGAEFLALLIWSALLLNAISHAFRSPFALLALSLPSAIAILAAALLFPRFEGPQLLAAALGAVIYVSYAAISGHRSVLAARELAAARVELEAQTRAAEAANQAKSAFLAMMSHELRTPMNGVLGMAHALQRTSLSPQQAEQVATLLQSGGGLMTILNDILDLAKIEAGRFDIEKRPFDLAQAVRRAVELWTPTAADKGLALTWDISPELPGWVSGDDARLRQVVQNLLSNAVKFTAEGQVRVSVVPAGDGDLVAFTVSDTGPGIEPAIQERLFQGFTQADSSIARRFGGAGLGLAISRNLAHLMGGEINLESRPAEGSRFTLVLPLPPASFQEAAEPGPQPLLKEAPVRALVVDDNRTNQIVARALLEALGLAVETAGSGQEGLKALEGGGFDIVFMDIHMPGMSGIETLAAIRTGGHGSVPVVALTADAMAGERERLLALGFNDYLSKPIEPAALIRTLGLAA
jgi:signal transduction histidine kinase/CheY-like chemotaxis protein